jgi:hypothetical protein
MGPFPIGAWPEIPPAVDIAIRREKPQSRAGCVSAPLRRNGSVLPGAYVALSSEVLPKIKEFGRLHHDSKREGNSFIVHGTSIEPAAKPWPHEPGQTQPDKLGPQTHSAQPTRVDAQQSTWPVP